MSRVNTAGADIRASWDLRFTCMFKKIWHDPVWSKVISALILSALAVTWAGIHFDWWSAVLRVSRSVIRSLFALLVTTSPIPHWLIGLAGLIVLLAFVILGTAVVVTHGASESAFARIVPPPAWLSYTTDTFYKVRWRWTYGADGEMTVPVCFCPRCDCQLVPHNRGRVPGMDTTGFHCPACDGYIHEVDKPIDYIEQTVALFIQKNIRNNTWAGRDSTAGEGKQSARELSGLP